jgi:hypothetical protein
VSISKENIGTYKVIIIIRSYYKNMSTLLEDFKNTKRELKRIYGVIGDEFGEIDDEQSVSKCLMRLYL